MALTRFPSDVQSEEGGDFDAASSEADHMAMYHGEPTATFASMMTDMFKQRIRFESLQLQAQALHAQELAKRAAAVKKSGDANAAMYVLILGTSWLRAPVVVSQILEAAQSTTQRWVRTAVADALDQLEGNEDLVTDPTHNFMAGLLDILLEIVCASGVELHQAHDHQDWLRIGYHLHDPPTMQDGASGPVGHDSMLPKYNMSLHAKHPGTPPLKRKPGIASSASSERGAASIQSPSYAVPKKAAKTERKVERKSPPPRRLATAQATIARRPSAGGARAKRLQRPFKAEISGPDIVKRATPDVEEQRITWPKAESRRRVKGQIKAAKEEVIS